MSRVPNKAAESLTLDGGKLGELCFQWQADRYSHQWRLGDCVLLESIEGPSKTAWPDSPPLQQVHLQSFADGRQVVFGVGMAGRGHWSASFTLVPELACWIVELACRSPIAPERLVSSYRANSLWQATPQSWQMGIAQSSLQLESIYPTEITSTDSQRIQMSPKLVADSTPTTIQWAFRLRVK